MRQLLWKEWHEQSWKLGFGCVVMGALAFMGLKSRILPDEYMMMWICFLGMALLPVLSSTGLIPAERSDGSFESLLAMPIASWKILLAKTLMGLCLCVGPMILAALISLAVTRGREVPVGIGIDLYIRSILVIVSLFVWMFALSSRLPSEARAGLVALGILIIWLITTQGLADPKWPWAMLAMPTSPFCFVYEVAMAQRIQSGMLPGLLGQAAILSLVWIRAGRSIKYSG